MARGNSQSYEGRVPAAKGMGPRNLTKSGTGPQPRMPRVRASRAASPRVNPRKASPGYNPPAGAGSGIAKATSPMASAPRKVINKSKTGPPRRSGRLPQPRADFPSRI